MPVALPRTSLALPSRHPWSRPSPRRGCNLTHPLAALLSLGADTGDLLKAGVVVPTGRLTALAAESGDPA